MKVKYRVLDTGEKENPILGNDKLVRIERRSWPFGWQYESLEWLSKVDEYLESCNLKNNPKLIKQTDWIKVTKVTILFTLLAANANAGQLTYSSDPQWQSREEVWQYQQIKRHEIKYTINDAKVYNDAVAIDSKQPAIQLVRDDEWSDAVHAVLNKKRR